MDDSSSRKTESNGSDAANSLYAGPVARDGRSSPSTAPYRPFGSKNAKKPEEKTIRYGIAFPPGLRAAYSAGFEMFKRVLIFPPIVIEELKSSRASFA